MSRGLKGLIFLVIALAVAGFFCGVVPFMLLPGSNIGVALPVSSMPGEKLTENFLGAHLTLTNTLVGAAVADALALLFVVGMRAGGGITEIPGGLQNAFEAIFEFFYNLAQSLVGENGAKLLPLALSIFVFVLLANWAELIPGVDSIGLMHCAPPEFKGYPANGNTLVVSRPFDAGQSPTAEQYEACAEAHHQGHVPTPDDGYLYVVTPFVRAAATDLNLTLGLGLIAMTFVQIWGVQQHGLGYFSKFLNLQAIGGVTAWKDEHDQEHKGNPMGIMDFIVGLIETISEMIKVVSFGFRLFGNIFAGQVLLFVMAFLVALLVPAVFYGLEIFVGFIQALVFALLTLVFGAMAMAGHGEGH